MIHPIDRAAGLFLAHGPDRLKFFSEGWGDEAHLTDLDATAVGPVAEIDITWDGDQIAEGLRVRDGWFESPVTALPEPSRRARVRMMTPAAGTDRLCVLMAAWNDHGYATRTKLATSIADHGIGSLILENPYYGARKPNPTVDQQIRTVADFASMGRAAIEEGRALLAALAPTHRMGVSGYSMGGNIAAFVGATVAFPVAVAPLAPSHSPGPVYLDGVLRNGIAWHALADQPDAEARLARLLGSASVLAIPPAPHLRFAVLVAARHDGFVPTEATVALHDHWRGSELRWVTAGHATLLWRRRGLLARGIADSFARLATWE